MLPSVLSTFRGASRRFIYPCISSFLLHHHVPLNKLSASGPIYSLSQNHIIDAPYFPESSNSASKYFFSASYPTYIDAKFPLSQDRKPMNPDQDHEKPVQDDNYNNDHDHQQNQHQDHDDLDLFLKKSITKSNPLDPKYKYFKAYKIPGNISSQIQADATVRVERCALYFTHGTDLFTRPHPGTSDEDLQPILPAPKDPVDNKLIKAVAYAEPKFAVFVSGAKQFKVTRNDIVYMERLNPELFDINDLVSFDRVLLVGTKHWTVLGRPYITNATVTATIEEHTKTAKVIHFAFRRRKNSKRTKGHRQWVTRLRINDILFDEPTPGQLERIPPGREPVDLSGVRHTNI